VAILGAVAAVVLVLALGKTRTLADWFFFDLLKIWLWALYFSFGCVTLGHALVLRLMPNPARSTLETLALSFPLGLAGFVLGMYAGGFLRIFGPVFAVALPALMIATGWRDARRALAESPRLAPPRLSVSAALISVFGSMALGVLYLGVLSPDALNYDSVWNHLVISQDYAREGRIVPFPGDWVKNLPHLGSIVNAWAFMVPGLPLPALHWMMALHLEFTVTVWTIVGVAAGAQWLAEREARGAWAMFFLFPGVFVYDSNMGASADHYLAVFTVAMFLLGSRTLERFDRRSCVAWGLVMGAAFLTKVHALYIGAPIAIASVVRAVYLTRRRAAGDAQAPSPREIAQGLGLAAATTVLVMSPYLVGHLVFFKNPVYPLLQNVFTASTPAVKDAALQMDYLFVDWHWHPPHALGERAWAALKMVFTFSFEPHYSFIDNLPMFGSLFTLGLAFLPFIPARARRLWWGSAVGLGALFTWAFTFWVDRNLQILMPLLAAVTAAVVIRAAELGRLARMGLALMLTVQLAWAVPFYFSGRDRIAGAVSLLFDAIRGGARTHLLAYRQEYVALGESLPKSAVVMLHNWHGMLGIDRPVLLDWIGYQGIIDYRTFRTPRDLYDRLRALGVTHVVYVPGQHQTDSKQEQVIFDTFAALYGTDSRQFGALVVFPLPAAPPPLEQPYRALTLGLAGYADGLYPIEALSVCEVMPPDLQRYPTPERIGAATILLDPADVVVVGGGASLDGATSEHLIREFRKVGDIHGLRVFQRSR
jgi:hypothetical protein